MPSAWIVKAIYVFEDGDLCFATRPPRSLPQQLSLDCLKEGFDRRVVVAIAFATHRHLEAMLAQDFLVVV